MSDIPSVVEYSVNLKDQEAPEPLPAGKYLGTIRGTENKMSQRGTLYCEVTFHIEAVQFPVDFKEAPEDGLTLKFRRVGLEDNPASRFGTKRFIQAIGAPLAKKIDTTEWIGHEAMLEVEHDKWEGITRAQIARVHPV